MKGLIHWLTGHHMSNFWRPIWEGLAGANVAMYVNCRT
jgi:hypothetical protein